MTPNLEDSFITAASAGDVDQLRILLTDGQESSSEETIQNLLTTAAKSSHLDVITFLLAQYPSIPLDEEIVRAAVNTGSIPIFAALLDRDPSVINMPFDRRGTPLTVACAGRQKVQYLRFLLEAGADPNQDPDVAGFPLALVAALYADPAAIDMLLQHGACLERSGALAAAACLGNEPMLCRLLERGARPDADATAIGSSGSPLHVAISRGHFRLAEILLRHGRDDPNATDASDSMAIRAH
jgi:ankyrin repeat protein